MPYYQNELVGKIEMEEKAKIMVNCFIKTPHEMYSDVPNTTTT